MQELLDDVFNIFANVASFSQCCGICNRERNIKQPGQGLCQQGFSGPGRADHQNIAFTELNVLTGFIVIQPLVVIVDRHRKHLLGAILTDDVFVKCGFDLFRDWQLARP